MKWDYEYNKENTWFIKDSGEERYDLNAGASFPLPHITKESFKILSVTEDDDIVKAELHLSGRTFTVSGNGEPVDARAYDDYMVAGDSVERSLYIKFSIE